MMNDSAFDGSDERLCDDRVQIERLAVNEHDQILAVRGRFTRLTRLIPKPDWSGGG
jgi:hypothetical protein